MEKGKAETEEAHVLSEWTGRRIGIVLVLNWICLRLILFIVTFKVLDSNNREFPQYNLQDAFYRFFLAIHCSVPSVAQVLYPRLDML